MTRSTFLAALLAALAASGSALADVAPEPDDVMGIEFRMTERGALVTGVARRSAAERAGVRRGDLILSVDNDYIFSLDQRRLRILTTGWSHPTVLLIVRNNRTIAIRFTGER